MSNSMLEETKDFELIPLDENEEAWAVRILEGDYVESVIQYGAVGFNKVKDCLTFNFAIVSSPDADLTNEDADFQIYAGKILESILTKGIEEGTVELHDVEDTE